MNATLNIAAHYNTETKQWIVRKKVLHHHLTGDGIYRDNQYGYGEKLVDALDEVLAQATTAPALLVCKVIMPGRRIHTLRIPMQEDPPE
jgi:hypothetical protein